MKPVQSEELSALLDGELDRDRMREAEAQLAADPDLRAELQLLRASDARWQTAAGTAAFAPTIRLPEERGHSRWLVMAAMAAIALTAVRVAAKLTDGWLLSSGLQGAALLVLIVLIVRTAEASESGALESGRLS